MYQKIAKKSFVVNQVIRFVRRMFFAALFVFAVGVNVNQVVAQTPAASPKKWTRAEKLVKDAERLAQNSAPDAKRRAAVKYEQAIKLFGANEPQRTLLPLAAVAKLYGETNQPDRSLASLRKSLVNVRAVKNRPAELTEYEGIVLLNIGEIYRKNGDRETALENYRQAFDLTRETKGYAAAGALNGIILLHLEAKQPERAIEFLEQEIARAAQDAETERALSDILNQVKNGTFKK